MQRLARPAYVLMGLITFVAGMAIELTSEDTLTEDAAVVLIAAALLFLAVCLPLVLTRPRE